MPQQQQLVTIQCPACGKTLAGWATQCQFCGAQTGHIPRPMTPQMQAKRELGMSWQEIAYFILAGLWTLSGIYGLLQAFGVMGLGDVGFGAGFGGTFSAIQFLLGLGLLTQNEWVVYIVRIFCYLQILFALLGFVFSFGAESTLAVLFFLGYHLFQLALACFQLYIFSVVSD